MTKGIMSQNSRNLYNTLDHHHRMICRLRTTLGSSLSFTIKTLEVIRSPSWSVVFAMMPPPPPLSSVICTLSPRMVWVVQSSRKSWSDIANRFPVSFVAILHQENAMMTTMRNHQQQQQHHHFLNSIECLSPAPVFQKRISLKICLRDRCCVFGPFTGAFAIHQIFLMTFSIEISTDI